MATNDALIEIATGSNYFFTGAADNDVVFYETSSNAKILLGTTSNTAPNLTIANGGVIGVNNVNPQSTLDVTGDIRFSGNLYQGSNLFTSGGGILSFEDSNNRVLSTSNSWSVLTNVANTYVAQQAAAIDGTNASDVTTCVRMDTSGQMYVSGSYSNSTSPIIYNANSSNFGSGSNSGLSFATSTAGTAFGLRYNSNGVCDVRVSVDGTGVESGTGIAVDSTNSILLCGTYASSNARVYDNLGESAIRLPAPIGSNFAFAVKYGSNAVGQLAVGIDTMSTDVANAVVTDNTNNINLAGSFTTTSAGTIVYNNYTENYTLGAFGEVSSPLSASTTNSMTFDSNNNLVFLENSGSYRLRRISPRGTATTIAGGSSGFSDATGTNARFSFSYGMCYDLQGNLFVVEYSRIRRVTPSGVVSTFAGQGTSGFSNANGTNAQFNNLWGICIDRSGNLYVSDIHNYMIRRITPNGDVSTLAGQLISGFSDATGTNALFPSSMRGICIDSNDNIYVADWSNQRVRRITPAGVVSTFAGSGTGTIIDGGTTVAFSFSAGPHGISIDLQGNVYVSDGNNTRIRRITPSQIVTTIAGNANSIYSDGLGTNATFNSISALTCDAYGNVYVGEASNGFIRRVETIGCAITTLVGNGTASSVDGIGINATINYPLGIVSDLSGNVYVADYVGHRIRRINPAGVVSTFAGSGTAGFSDATGTIAMFNNPTGLCIDRSQNLYVCDFLNNRIRMITPSGVVSTFAGSGTSTWVDGIGTNAGLGLPAAICMDFNGDLLVCDRNSHTIRRITPTAVVTTIAGTGTAGFSDSTGTNAAFNIPNGICIDSNRNIYVSDRANHRIRRITPAGVVSTFLGTGTATLVDGFGTNAAFNQPCGLWADPNNNIYVADLGNNSVRKISNISSGQQLAVTTVVGSATSGYSDASGANALLTNPECVCMDTNGTMYISDANNHRIRTIAPPVVVTTFAGSGITTNGLQNGTGTNAAFVGNMYQMCVDLEGSIYLGVDYNTQHFNTMRRISSSGVVTTHTTGQGTAVATCIDDNYNGYCIIGRRINGFNRTGMTSLQFGDNSTGFSDATGTNARFSSPLGICVERGGTNVYVADTGNHRIRRIVPWSRTTTTIAGQAASGFSDATGTNALFSSPQGICVDSTGIVYVADTGNNRIRRIGLDGAVTTIAGSSSSGASDGQGTNASFTNMRQLSIDRNDVLFLVESGGRVCRITTSGIVRTIAGGTSGYSDGFGTNARFNSASGICVDLNNNIYVADSGNFRIRKINVASSFINGMTPSPTVSLPTSRIYTGIVSSVPYVASAYSEVTTFAGNGTASTVNATGTNATFNAPHGICSDLQGNVYVADFSGNVIRRITPSLVVTTFAGSGTSGFSDSTGTLAMFNNPIGACSDVNGNIYISDHANHRIRRITPAGVVTTIAGNGSATHVNGTGTNASFQWPAGICIDPNGNLYVADISNHVIRRIETTNNNTVTTIAGQPLTSGYSDATGTNARFNNPIGVTIDTNGVLYVADRFNHSIRRVTTSGVVTTWAGLNSAGFTNATGTNARFNEPSSVSCDISGNVFVVDRNNIRIRMITPSQVVSTVAGTNVGTADGVGTNAQMNSPFSVAVDSTSSMLYVADAGNNRIRRIELAGVSVSTYAGSGTVGFTDGNGVLANFNNPSGICMDSNRTMYVADFSNHRIRRITANGEVTVLAGSGVAGYADGVGTNARFNNPNAICLDSGGNLYVVEYTNHVIRRITPTGVVTTFAGSGVAGFSDATGTNALFNIPWGICIDTSGNLYVTELNNHRVRRITPARVVTTYAGTGTAGSTNATGTNASFNNPTGICIDASGNLYVNEYTGCLIRRINTSQVVTTLAGGGVSGSVDGVGTNARFWDMFLSCIDSQNNILLVDRNHRVRKVSQSGVVTTLAGSGTATFLNGIGTSAGFNTPLGICTDSLGTVYVAEFNNNRIRTITPPMNVMTLAGSGVIGFSDATGTNASFRTPSGVCVDVDGNIYITDTDNHAIRKITQTGIVTTLAGNGIFGFSDATGTNARFFYPCSPSVDVSGNLYVADISNHRIRRITPNGVVTTLAGNGSAGFSNATGTNAQFNNPFGTCVDIQGNVYVSDLGNNIIRMITPTGVVSTFAGQTNSGFSDATGTNARFNAPRSISIDINGNLYVSDGGNNRIRQITTVGIVTTIAGQTTSGFSDAFGTNAMFNSPQGISVDMNGFVYVGDTANHRIRQISPSGVVTTLSGNGSSGNSNGTGTNAIFNTPTSLFVDNTRTIYLTDYGNSLIRKISPLNNAVYSVNIGTSASNTAAFAVRYNSSGTSQWSLTMDGAAADATMALATDSSQNLYMAGYYGPNRATFYQGNTPSVVSLQATQSNSMGAFCSKADSNGIFNWAVSVDGTTTDQALGVTTDTSGNVYLCGTYGPNVATVYSANNSNSGITLPAVSNLGCFVLRYNSNGILSWARTIRGVSSNIAYGIAVDNSANVYVGGMYQGVTSPSIFSSNDSNTTLSLPAPTGNAGSNTAGFVVRYNSSGTPQNAWAVGGRSNAAVYSIAVDGSGTNVAIAGLFTGGGSNTTLYDPNSNPASITFPTAITTQAGFAVKYSLSGTPSVLRSIGSNGQQKYVTNIGSSNLVLNVTNSNNTFTNNSYTLSAGTGMIFNYYGSNWYAFNN